MSRDPNGPVSPFYVTLGGDLKRIRTAKGHSLADVQRLSGRRFTASVVKSYEMATRRISIESLFVLAEVYGVPVTTFLPRSAGGLVVPLNAAVEQLQRLAVGEPGQTVTSLGGQP